MVYFLSITGMIFIVKIKALFCAVSPGKLKQFVHYIENAPGKALQAIISFAPLFGIVILGRSCEGM
jgi:hypothetical protein